ncbi:hypothetical protein SAMN05444266_106242 [Chitinophaga jiangningensis]|uniref:Uncharacterized protein n=1 Tax=Chitinophaga jiangningensis TaxID=1419482 RepID=A0A1M7FS01_9BACT|nr:hypothetical protein [Chitinophaga jiangningensis]SHM06459.1 hypothetical protein SAMN05444266_106242 [Chitinophaga jiangningensis]
MNRAAYATIAISGAMAATSATSNTGATGVTGATGFTGAMDATSTKGAGAGRRPARPLSIAEGDGEGSS